MKRVRRITAHVDHYRFRDEFLHGGVPIGYVVHPAGIITPYSHSPSRTVYDHPKYGPVIILETAHKRFDVFSVRGARVYATDAEATDAYLVAKRGHDTLVSSSSQSSHHEKPSV